MGGTLSSPEAEQLCEADLVATEESFGGLLELMLYINAEIHPRK